MGFHIDDLIDRLFDGQGDGPDSMPAAIAQRMTALPTDQGGGTEGGTDQGGGRAAAADGQHSPAVYLLAQLVAAGFAVRADSERLFISPRAMLTAAQCRAIARHKAELLALVQTLDAIDQVIRRWPDPPDKPMDPALVREWLAAGDDMSISEWLQRRNQRNSQRSNQHHGGTETNGQN